MKIKYVKEFMMDWGEPADLTLGGVYDVTIDETDRDTFFIFDDSYQKHYFDNFGISNDPDFKTEDYFEIVEE